MFYTHLKINEHPILMPGNDSIARLLRNENVQECVLKNITFDGVTIEDKSKLVATVNKRQDNYQIVSIGKGNGHGDVGNVEVLKD